MSLWGTIVGAIKGKSPRDDWYQSGKLGQRPVLRARSTPEDGGSPPQQEPVADKAPPGTKRIELTGRNLLGAGSPPQVKLGGQPLGGKDEDPPKPPPPSRTVNWLVVLLGTVLVGLAVAVVVLATDSGSGGKTDPGSAHVAGAPASSGTPTGSGTNSTTESSPNTTTAPATTTTSSTPTTTTTTPPTTATSTGEDVIP